MKVKHLCHALVMGVFVTALGCEQDATDVDTTVPQEEPVVVPDEEPATSGYRGGVQEETEEPDSAPIVVDPEPDATIRLEDRTSQPTLGEPGTPADQQQQGIQPPTGQQPAQDGVQPAEQEPAVQEVPAETIPPEGNTGGGEQEESGS